MRLSFLLCLASALTLAAGCDLFDTTCKQGDRSCVSNNEFAAGLSATCARDLDCKNGLYCISRTCQAKGDTPRDDKCRLTAECGDKDYCGSERLCKQAGVAAAGQECQYTSTCTHGLVCQAMDVSQLQTVSLSGLANAGGACTKAGRSEQGAKCTQLADCLAGLSCLEVTPGDRRCSSPPSSAVEQPALPALWAGEKCPSVAATDPALSYFEVPRPGKAQSEFYALPFPNDVRRKGGKIDLGDHPMPPSSYGLPYLERYVDVASHDLDGFSTNPVVFFRFSQTYDFDTVACQDPGPCAVRIVDITPSSPEYGTKASIEWKTTKGPVSNYICEHWLALRRPVGTPLRAHTTYAAIITKDIHPKAGGSYERASDFDAMLASSAPSDVDLQDAYAAYAPLRAYIKDKSEDADNILNAAVFTTSDPEALMPKLRLQIQADSAPTLSQLTTCASASTKSPCEDAEGRGACHPPSSAFVEVHGRLKLPIFQAGSPPYAKPEDGGDIQLDSTGAPIIQDHRDVCFAISVPAAPAPASGYPVLVFAHGTGGSFADQMGADGFASAVATGTTPAVLVAIDLPEHGDRRGSSTESPEDLFYNFLNPRAARDNVIEGAADLMSLVRWVKQGGFTASASPTGAAVPFDTTRIALMGHSQGATHSSLMLSYEPDLIGAVLSGNGAHLSSSLLYKTSPVDIASVVPIALLDEGTNGKLAGDEYNPALAVIQSVFDVADPINYAHRLYRQPSANVPTGQHVFMTYGVGDTYSPEQTQAAYARAGHLVVVTPVISDLKLTTAAPPLSGNETIGGSMRTVGLRQYMPTNGVDGHFVATDQGQPGRPDVERFLDQLLSGMTPEIGK